VQRWPVEPKAPSAIPALARSRSASASTIAAFLPPQLGLNGYTPFSASRRDVAAGRCMPGDTDSADLFGVEQRLGGRSAARCQNIQHTFGQARLEIQLGQAHSAGGRGRSRLRMTELPAISAGAIFHAGIANGKFQGVMHATTPSG